MDGWSSTDVYELKSKTINLIYFPTIESFLELYQLFPIRTGLWVLGNGNAPSQVYYQILQSAQRKGFPFNLNLTSLSTHEL